MMGCDLAQPSLRVNGVLLGGLVRRQVTCFYHLLGVVASVGEAKGAPSCCGLAARSLLFALLLTKTLQKMGSLPQRALPVTLDLLEG